METDQEKQVVLYKLAQNIAENNRRESEAVQGYTQQLEIIQRAKDVCSDDAEVLSFLTALESATEEKISDELSHSISLNKEYTQMTDIQPKED